MADDQPGGAEGDFLTIGRLECCLGLTRIEATGETRIQDGEDPKACAARYALSPREAELAFLMVKGRSSQEIADKLHISLGTVKNHISKICQKTGVKSRIALVRLV